MTTTELLLITLMEECDETSQRVSKALRFGLNEVQPEQLLNNSERIVYEFNDIMAVMEILLDHNIIDKIIDREAIELKKEKIYKYFNYSIDLGIVKG